MSHNFIKKVKNFSKTFSFKSIFKASIFCYIFALFNVFENKFVLLVEESKNFAENESIKQVSNNLNNDVVVVATFLLVFGALLLFFVLKKDGNNVSVGEITPSNCFGDAAEMSSSDISSLLVKKAIDLVDIETIMLAGYGGLIGLTCDLGIANSELSDLINYGISTSSVEICNSIENIVAQVPAIEDIVAQVPAIKDIVAQVPAIKDIVAQVPAISNADIVQNIKNIVTDQGKNIALEVQFYVDKLSVPFTREDLRKMVSAYVYSSDTIVPFTKAVYQLTEKLYGDSFDKVLAQWHFDIFQISVQETCKNVVNVMNNKRFIFDPKELLETFSQMCVCNYLPHIAAMFYTIKKGLFLCLFSNIRNMPHPGALRKLMVKGKAELFSIGQSKIFNIYVWETHFDWFDSFNEDK